MKRIELTRGQYTIIDDCDYEMVSKFKWHVINDRTGFYAGRCEKIKGTRKVRHFLMHREMLSAPKGIQVDHVNGDRLDNRRENLRLCNNRQNARNQRKRKGCRSKYKGVYRVYVAVNGQENWCANICLKDRRLYLGYFKTQKEAALAYNEAAKQHYGEFARLNKVA